MWWSQWAELKFHEARRNQILTQQDCKYSQITLYYSVSHKNYWVCCDSLDMARNDKLKAVLNEYFDSQSQEETEDMPQMVDEPVSLFNHLMNKSPYGQWSLTWDPACQEGQIQALVRCGPVSNASQYFMPVTSTKICLKLNGLWHGQVFQDSRASNFGQISKLSKILCLSYLFASFIMIWLNLNTLPDTRLNIIFFWHSRASNSNINILSWPEFELIPDFMPAMIICKFDGDPMKTEHARLDTVSFPL